jgi:hypothetical protein
MGGVVRVRGQFGCTTSTPVVVGAWRVDADQTIASSCAQRGPEEL